MLTLRCRPLPPLPLVPRPCTRVTAVASAATTLALLVGCAQLPDRELVSARYAAAEAQFKSAWGPIPARRSAALLAELKRKSGHVDLLDRQLTLEQVLVGEPLVVGNRVTLLQDGPATYASMFAAIQAARDHINVESFIIDDGEVGGRFADLLLDRRRAGVEVNLMYDSVGSLKTPRAYFDRLRRGGVRVIEFNPINPLAARHTWTLDHRDHRKLLIVDGRTAFLGGINIDSVYASGSSGASASSGGGSSSSSGGGDSRGPRPGWRDTDVRIDGPVVTDFQKLFAQSWAKQHGPPLSDRRYYPMVPPEGTDVVRAIGSTPDEPYSATYLTLLAAITNAEQRIYITNAYFVPDRQLVDALTEAVRRGVDVRLMLTSTSDSHAAAYAAHSYYKKVLQRGVRIFERRSTLLHAKTVVIDGVWSSVGSANLDWRSALHNDEISAVILGQEFGAQMEAAFRADAAQADEITLERWVHRPLSQRLKEWFFRLCHRLL
jgi:cardiolipin synthase